MISIDLNRTCKGTHDLTHMEEDEKKIRKFGQVMGALAMAIPHRMPLEKRILK